LSTSAIVNRRSTNRGVSTKTCTARPLPTRQRYPLATARYYFRRAEPACM